MDQIKLLWDYGMEQLGLLGAIALVSVGLGFFLLFPASSTPAGADPGEFCYESKFEVGLGCGGEEILWRGVLLFACFAFAVTVIALAVAYSLRNAS